jgi:hypothetical protein
MNDHEITVLLDRLVETSDDDTGDWDEVLARSAESRRVGVQRTFHHRRSGRPRSGRSMLLLGTAVVVVAVVALAVTSPWRRGPSILDRAAAAIALPASGQILYENITLHVTPTPPPQSVRARMPPLPPGVLHPPYAFDAHVRVWLTGGAPRRFRFTEHAVVHGRLGGRAAIQRLQSAEIGGRLTRQQALSYDAPSGALVPAMLRSPVKRSDLDVAEFVWQAITAGRAKVDGTTYLHGQLVVRIRVFARISGYLEGVGLYFVDAQTYKPVRVVVDLRKHFFNEAVPGFPLLALTPVESSSLPTAYGRYVFDFNEYRHLSPTSANNNLANIREAHPKAKIV